MPEFLTRIQSRIMEYWNKLTNRQRVQIVTTAVIAIVALVVLVMVLNRTTYKLYDSDLTPTQINEMKTIFDANGIKYQVGEDTASILVEDSKIQDAELALASGNFITTTNMTYQELFNTSIVASEKQKMIRYKIYAEGELAEKIKSLEAINTASVSLVLPETGNTILDDEKPSEATAIVGSVEPLSSGTVEGIVTFLSNAVEGLDKEHISVISQYGEILYNGEIEASTGTTVNSQFLKYKRERELLVKNNLRAILLSGGEYDEATVSVQLELDMDQQEQVIEKYFKPDGESTGIPLKEIREIVNSKNQAPGGTPGTDANATGTFVVDSNESSYSADSKEVEYTYDKTLTTVMKAIGGVQYDQSTVTVVLNKYVPHYQSLLEADGTLDSISWEQYIQDNDDTTSITNLSDDYTKLIKTTSNIDNIVVVANLVPKFYPKEEAPSQIVDYLLIGVIVVMILLLAYAVYRGTEPVEITEIEPELSVEDMLETTKETRELDEIEFSDKSEARTQIEMFVDDNPEAVALLLRNWLNEDWE